MTTRASEVERARRRRWRITVSVVRSTLSTALMVVVYYRAPLDRPLDAWLAFWLALGGAALAAVLFWQLRAIVASDNPRLRAVETAAIGLPFVLLCYASVYSLLSFNEPASFTEVLDRTDALYFTMAVFATVGFGDIAPVTEVARIVTTTQMAAGIVAIGLVAKLLVGAVKAAEDRRTAGTGEVDADPPPSPTSFRWTRSGRRPG